MSLRSQVDSSVSIPWDRNAFRAHGEIASRYQIISRRLVYKDGELLSVVVTFRKRDFPQQKSH